MVRSIPKHLAECILRGLGPMSGRRPVHPHDIIADRKGDSAGDVNLSPTSRIRHLLDHNYASNTSCQLLK